VVELVSVTDDPEPPDAYDAHLSAAKAMGVFELAQFVDMVE
jgi:hypothetical protein